MKISAAFGLSILLACVYAQLRKAIPRRQREPKRLPVVRIDDAEENHMQIIRYSALKPAPWLNGDGVTRLVASSGMAPGMAASGGVAPGGVPAGLPPAGGLIWRSVKDWGMSRNLLSHGCRHT